MKKNTEKLKESTVSFEKKILSLMQSKQDLLFQARDKAQREIQVLINALEKEQEEERVRSSSGLNLYKENIQKETTEKQDLLRRQFDLRKKQALQEFMREVFTYGNHKNE